LQQIVLGDFRLRPAHHDQQRPLVPLGMAYADHRRLGDARAAHGGVLEIDRADPFAARLDDVLGAVGDDHRAIRFDLADVAGHEPVVVEELRAAFALHVALHDPRTAYDKIAGHAAVARQVVAGVVDDLHLAAEYRPARLGGDGEALGIGQ